MMHLRQPILLPKEQPLRGLIHARFSTEEQRQSSIDDQVASCRTFLESNLPKGWKPEQVQIDVIAEPEVSGEIADRPGINQVWAGIEAKRWHLIIAEESSRLYRHHTKAGELFESAVDADVRVICTSDYIDTADDDWPDRLHMSQMQHARSNFYTRKRIERAHDGLWARGAAVGNTVIGYKRRVFQKPVRGAGHPLRGTTRQRRGLLAGVFNCGVCGAPMYSYGKTDGSFRCSASATGKCWNRVYCMRERVYPAVLEAVVNEVLSLDGVRDAVLARVKELHEKDGAVAAELKKLDKEEKRLLAGIERLSAAVESGDGALVSLTARLAEREQELVIVRARRREVEEQAGRKAKLPSTAKLLEHLGALKGQLFGDEARAAVILRQLLNGPIRVVPFMRIDGKRVVPRLEFTINLVAALPSAVAGPLRQAAAVEEEPPVMLERPLVVNAFAEPQLVKHARVALKRRLAGKTYKEIAKELDMTKDHMRNCARSARLMEDAGIPEPYHRLTEKPDRVSQWCSKHWLKAGDRKGGGKRRRAS